MTSHTVTFQPSGVNIRCRPDQTIAEAALEQGVVVPVSCENAVCLICQAKPSPQSTNALLHFRNSLGADVWQQQQHVLCCTALPQSDIELVMNDVYAPNHKPQLTLACQVASCEALSDEMFRIWLRAPAGKTLDYWAGQYLLLHAVDEHGNEQALPYSIASAPPSLTGQDSRLLELHIANSSDTAQAVLNFLRNAIIVKVTLPAGECILHERFLRAHQGQPLLMVAAGSGFSQIKALTEAALAINPAQEVHLYWSNRQLTQFYLADVIEQWLSQHPNVHYHPILEQPNNDWSGRSGWLYQMIRDDFSDLQHVQLFACGSPNMVYGTFDQLEALGLSMHNMHADAFSYAPRPAR